MTSHDLARKLLAGPDLPVELKVQGNIGDDGKWDAFWGDLHNPPSYDADKVTLCVDTE